MLRFRNGPGSVRKPKRCWGSDRVLLVDSRRRVRKAGESERRFYEEGRGGGMGFSCGRQGSRNGISIKEGRKAGMGLSCGRQGVRGCGFYEEGRIAGMG